MAHFDYSDKAHDDLMEILEYIALDNVDAALRVNEAIEETANFLYENPGIGTQVDQKYENLLMCPVKRFKNYLLFFQREESRIYIQRIFHGSRNIQERLDD